MAEAIVSALKVPVGQKHPVEGLLLTPSGRGVFDVKKDGHLVFSKKAAGRYPTSDEIIALLKS